jgi:transcriptional regulator with XRE-family HTH domain
MKLRGLGQAVRRARAQRRLPEPAARRQLREAAGLTQQELARSVGVSREEVSRWESGRRSPRRGRTLLRYLTLLDLLAAEAAGAPGWSRREAGGAPRAAHSETPVGRVPNGR